MIEERRSNDLVASGVNRAPRVAETPPSDLRASRVQGSEREVVVFSYPTGSSEAALVERLTGAERGVLELLLEGKTNARIALARGTTLRTVSKQVDAVYKKLEVHSRAELSARFAQKK